MAEADAALLDGLYDATLDPNLWRPTIARFADMIGGQGGWLSQLDVATGDGISEGDPISRVDPLWRDRYAEYFAQRNPFMRVDDPLEYTREWKPRILTDDDWISREELKKTEFYNDFWRPQDINSALMMRLALNGMEVAVLNIGRPERRGPFDKTDLDVATHYHPHFIRAFKLARKLSSTNRLRGEMASVLDLSPHGLFVLDFEGRVRHINRIAEAMLAARDSLCVAGGRLGAIKNAAARQLQALTAAAGAKNPEQRSGGTMALFTPTRRLPLSITVAPVTSDRLSAFHEGRCILVCVTDLDAGTPLPEQKLRDLFGLTAAEARVAVALFEGLSPRETAERFGVSPNTVHIQLARIFEKTGTNRQSDLARLLMRSVGAFPP